MEIKKVQLNHIPAVTEPFDENGLGQPTHDDIFSFLVTREDGSETIIPNDPANADYWRVKEWYDNQQNKPFDFEFEQLPEANFEETIYPEEEESETEG